jgi:hypothetical protein
MNLPVYVIGQLITLVLVAGLLSTIYVAFSKLLQQRAYPSIQQKKFLSTLFIFLLAWLFILGFLSLFSFFHLPISAPVLLLLILVIPTTVFFFCSLLPFSKQLLQRIDGRWLIRIQGFRIITELLFWIGFKAGFVPMQMTFYGFNYDIIVGLSAILGSQVFFMGQARKPEIVIWNSFGLISILYLVIISAASLPHPGWQLFAGPADSQFLLEAPYVWLMGFVYPMAIVLHIASIRQAFINPDRKEEAFSGFSTRIRRLGS